ncbi:MAG TPA: tetratricopeptide repeat protein, partial [Armatimonadota bacterium]|nr:tetratricopeptide repeat protein [Armatimonadota bacterium]
MTERTWIQIGLDDGEARRLGMPSSLPVPGDAYDGFAETPPTFEEFVAWTLEFIAAMPEHALAQALAVFARKGPLWIAARAHLVDGAWAAALPLLEQILTLDPEDAAAQFNLGAVYRNLGDPGRSLAQYARCEAVFSGEGLFYTNRARTHEALGERDSAIADYLKALELLPGDPFALEQLTRMGALVELAPDPDDPESTIYITREDYQAVVRAYWDGAPQTPAFFTEQARVLLEEDRAELAAQAADRALALAPDTADAWLFKGIAQWRLRRLDAAVAALEECLALEPDSYEGRVNLARVIWEQRGPADAAPYLEAVIDRDPNALAPLRLLAATTHDADVEGAVARLRAVHRRYPDAWAPLRALGDLYWRAEDADAALAAYAEALSRGADDETRAGYLALLGELGRTEALCRAADATPALARRGLAVRWNALR